MNTKTRSLVKVELVEVRIEPDSGVLMDDCERQLLALGYRLKERNDAARYFLAEIPGKEEKPGYG